MSALHITARRWEHGWELYEGDECITQCATLDQADRQVRDYKCTMHDLAEYTGDIVIIPDVEGVRGPVERLVASVADATAVSARAAKDRDTVMHTMKDAGFSYADIAGAIGVTKGRVSQLIGTG